MRRLGWTVLSAVVAGLAMACAPPPPDEPEAMPGGDARAVSAAIEQSWQAARRNIEESAELMTADDYDFTPVGSVRSFSRILTHLAGANYTFCSAARGEASPNGEESFENVVTERAEIIRVLEESLAYCDAAYATATDASLADSVEQPFGGGPGPRAAALLGNINHLNEHYGNLVTYFRLKDIVPPSSRR